MNMRLLHFHYDSPDTTDDEFYLIVNGEEKGMVALRIEGLEKQYRDKTPEDERSRYEMADYVVERMREAGYTLIWIGKQDVIKREYEEG